MTTTAPTYLAVEQVAARIGVKPKTVRDYVYRDAFPPPDTYFGRSPVWLESTVVEWIEANR